MLLRIQPATGNSSNDCMSLHTQRTGSIAIASLPIPSEDPHASVALQVIMAYIVS
jgi:hypothetical protein